MPNRIRIRLHTIAAGPDISLSPGLVEVDPALAEALIAAGHAEFVPEPEIEVRTTNQAEVVAAHVDGESTAGESGVVETATASPQRSQAADDLVAAERAGHEAAAAGEERKNPYDRRTGMGKAWDRGFDSYGQEYRAFKQG